MSGFDLGFDLSAEAWDVCAPVWYRTSSGSRQHRGDAVAWTLSSKHSPAGVKKFGIINNRAFLFAVPDGLATAHRGGGRWSSMPKLKGNYSSS